VVKTAKCIMEQNLLFGYGDGDKTNGNTML